MQKKIPQASVASRFSGYILPLFVRCHCQSCFPYAHYNLLLFAKKLELCKTATHIVVKSQKERRMFNDNWYLFLLIVMLVFFADGNVSQQEGAVLLAIVFALAITNTPTTDTTTTSCFCNHDM